MTGDGGFILDQPHQIQAFALLQIYYKLKMEVEHPKGPRWRVSPLQQAIQILEANDIVVEKRTRKFVFPVYKAFLVSAGILSA